MAQRRPKKRSYKLINFKVYYDTDEDLIAWWEDIEAGERSDAIRDVLRDHLGVRRQSRQTKIIELPELIEVRRDTLWIKDALNEMPAYLERVIQHVAATTVGQPPARASPAPVSDEPALSEAESQRRTRRMKRASW